MSIFQIDEASQIQRSNMPKMTKDELQWVNIGVEWSKAKAKGMSAKAFADEKGINYGTFTKSMSRYKLKIELAVKADALSKKPDNRLTKADRAVIMINSFRQSLRSRVADKGAAQNNKSAKWFSDTLRKGVKGHKVSRPIPGKVYAYQYDAKHKATLPYWDKYPLIVFLGFYKSSKSNTLLMHGLNMHYIPPKARQQFLEDLLKQYASTRTITNSTKLNIDWSKVKGFQGADQMIKAYLPAHIQGPIIEIKPSDWANVVLMPLQSFVSNGSKFSSRKVWSK